MSVLTAATLQATDYVTPVVLGDYDKINLLAKDKGLDVSDIEIINPSTSELKPELVKSFVERRKGKATEEQADELLNNVNYFGTVSLRWSCGLVSGAAHSTGDTVLAHYKIIKNQAYLLVFFMIKDDQQYVGDCAINPTLESSDLAEIAVESAKSAKSFGMDPCCYVKLLN